MNRLKRLFIAVVLIIAGQSAIAAEAEVGGMFSLTLNKQFNDYFSANIQNHLWLDRNFTGLERYMGGINFKTTLVKKYLYFDAFYWYRYRNKNGNEHTHRYQFGLSGGYSLPRVKFSGVSKMESNHVFLNGNAPYNIYYWRNRVAVNGILKNNDKVSPFGGIEVFNLLNWREEFNLSRGHVNKKGVELIWLDFGVDYKINKTFTMTFMVREQIMFFSPKYSTMLGASCKINL